MTFHLSAEDREIHERLRTDLEFFARHIQRIEPKDLVIADDMSDAEMDYERQLRLQSDVLRGEDSIAGMIPFIFRPGQRRLHEFVTDMKKRRGKVRAILVKPRQVGWSTYIQCRAHWLATKTPGMKIFIVSHNAESTRKFLRRARKLCLAAPASVTPGRQVENSKELIFDNAAAWAIATAGSPDAMRSDNCHFLHASEEPYFPEQQNLMGAVIPALSDGPGSEAFRESTSRGKGNTWHNTVMEAVAGESEFEVFFDPWFNQPTYRATPPPGWVPDDEAKETWSRFPHLTIDQMFWRAMRIKTLKALWMFKQEFPATLDESFQSSANTLYLPDAIAKARSNDGRIPLDDHAPLIMGIDPARTGDRTVIAFRQGNVFREIRVFDKMDDMQLVGVIAKYLRDGYKGKRVARCFIDYAIGEGPASRLRELGFGQLVQTVHFGETPAEPRYANKRIEMAMDLRDWMGDTGEHVSIPNHGATNRPGIEIGDDIASDLLAIPDFVQMTGSEKLKLPPKDQIKKEYGKSPDIFDAMILTFAYPVAAERVAGLQQFARNNLSHMNPTELSVVLSDFDK